MSESETIVTHCEIFQLVAKRREWEEEAEEHLRNVASAHSEHLEQVVRTQKQLCDIEQKQKVAVAYLLYKN